MIRIFTLGLLAACLSGCQVSNLGIGYLGGWDSNITKAEGRWAGFEPEGVYELRRAVFLWDVEDRTNGLALVPGMEIDVRPGTFRGPTSVEEYQQQRQYFRTVRGTVDAGVRVRATMLRAKGNLRARRLTQTYLKGKILDGPFRGELVDLEPVSIYRVNEETGALVLKGPNEDILGLVR